MLQIKRVKSIIITANDGNFGFDHCFFKGLNLIASTENTKGKSSIIEAIYYCLGMEELLGAINEKSLKPVYKSAIDYGEKKNIVPIKTSFYLEVINSEEKVITINRDVERPYDNNNLIKVFFGTIDESIEGKCSFKEMYVNTKGGATSPNGFHNFLEQYIGWNLPAVPTFEDRDRKLYIQTVFSSMFIEQKRGWSNLLATIPNYYGIKDVKTKVLEYILNLDTIKNEQLKIECKIEEALIKEKWKSIVLKINDILNNKNCTIRALYETPKIIQEENTKQMIVYKIDNNEEINLEEYLEKQKNKVETLSQQNLKVGNNIEELENKLEIVKIKIQEENEKVQHKNKELLLEKSSVNKLKESLEIINRDLNNNRDINKLKKLGGLKDTSIAKEVCPTCHQNIKDCLLEQPLINKVMNIEEQIKHLTDQKKMLEFAIDSHKNNIKAIEGEVKLLESTVASQTKECRRLVNDIYSTDECLSTSIVYEKLTIENEIDELIKLQKRITEYKQELLTVSSEWAMFLEKKKNLPKGIFSEKDIEKKNSLKKLFIDKLTTYHYESTKNTLSIEISNDNLMPVVDGFDLKKDCSGSDLIRVIWDFTLSLLSTSIEHNGNHPQLVIFDEPAQQSIKNEDLYSFIDDIVNNYQESQIIVGITLNSGELAEYVKKIDNINLIMIEDKAIKPI